MQVFEFDVAFENWRLVFSQDSIRVYRTTKEETGSRSPIHIDMRRLGRVIPKLLATLKSRRAGRVTRGGSSQAASTPRPDPHLKGCAAARRWPIIEAP